MNVAKKLLPLTLAALIGGGGGAAVALGVADDATTTTVNAVAPGAASQSVSDDDGSALSADEIYARSKDSVAFITARVTSPGAADPTGQPSEGVATGSGFVVSRDGYIATNAHVVEGATSVKVKIGDGGELDAQVIGRDTSTDVALLKVDAGGQALTPLAFGDS
ncbi:MAG TPA: trypsin-like peptidase domain-containing protein, partial [Thermoleophilaceae bacterium]